MVFKNSLWWNRYGNPFLQKGRRKDGGSRKTEGYYHPKGIQDPVLLVFTLDGEVHKIRFVFKQAEERRDGRINSSECMPPLGRFRELLQASKQKPSVQASECGWAWFAHFTKTMDGYTAIAFRCHRRNEHSFHTGNVTSAKLNTVRFKIGKCKLTLVKQCNMRSGVTAYTLSIVANCEN